MFKLSHEFRDPKKFLETLRLSKQETIGLPVDICIDSLLLEAYVEELGQQAWSDFYDLVVAYMEYIFNLNDKLDCLLHNQTHFVHVWLSTFPIVSWFKHSLASSLPQLLDWLVWYYNIT